MPDQLKILPQALLSDYQQNVPVAVEQLFSQLKDSLLSTKTFDFYASISAVFSSKIEGEPIEVDSYLKYKLLNTNLIPDLTKKVDDLLEAYQFAQTQPLSFENLMQAHRLLSRNLLAESSRGRLRTGQMFVMDKNSRITYVAASSEAVKAETEALFQDIDILLTTEISATDAFFFAAMIHLVFVKIHPLEDGNGRTARLLEKWFLAEKMGRNAWFLQSEKLYYERIAEYGNKLQRIGFEYNELNYGEALSFLLLLPQALNY